MDLHRLEPVAPQIQAEDGDPISARTTLEEALRAARAIAENRQKAITYALLAKGFMNLGL